MYYGFALFSLLPQASSGSQSAVQAERFAIDYTFWLNLFFLGITTVLLWLRFGSQESEHGGKHHHHSKDKGILENLLFWLAILSYIWLAGGIVVSVII